MSLPPGAVPLLTVYVQPDGNVAVNGPVDDVPALMEVLGKAMLVLSGHHAAKAAQSKVLIAKPAPTLNGSLPPLRRIP